MTTLMAILVLGSMALIFGAILGFASVKFHVEGDPLAEQVDAILPQTQCGECGYPGCKPYAEAVTNGEAINKCAHGGEDTIKKIADLRARISNIKLEDKSNAFNTARIEALEVQNLLEVAEATAIAAEERKESRGAHARDDFQERDDENWLCHSLYFPSEKRVGKRAVNFAPKPMNAFEPTVRSY